MTNAQSTVYLVLEGTYSEEHVIAVFSNEHDATTYAALQNGHEYNDYADVRVDAMSLDDPEQCKAIRDLNPRWQYSTWGWNKVKDVGGSIYPTLAPEQPPTRHEARNPWAIARGYHRTYWDGVIVARNKDEAIKIVSDIYAQKMAETSGIA